MSISLTQFIKHDFHDIKDKQASLEFVKKSIRRIQDVLGFEDQEIEHSVFEYEDILDIECFLAVILPWVLAL